MYGKYEGKMTLSPSESAAGIDIKATMGRETVAFEDFPVRSIVASLVPAEMVDALMGVIGKVQYSIGYQAVVNGAKDGFVLEFDPQPLELSIAMSETLVSQVRVTVSASDKGAYTIGTKQLKFAIKATQVILNEALPLENFSELNFSFDLTRIP